MIEILGLRIPAAGPGFLAALAVHVLAGLTCVVTGAVAATARKRPGRHPRWGTGYLYGLSVVFATAVVMSLLRWQHNRHLLGIALIAYGLGLAGRWAHRHRPPRWMVWHGIGMGGSYLALLTGFYVDNGPQLPLWDRLPHLAYWVLPTLVGTPVIWWALIHNGALGSPRPVSRRRPAAPQSGASTPPRA